MSKFNFEEELKSFSPQDKKDWDSFSPKEKEAARLVAEEIHRSGQDPKTLVDEVIRKLEGQDKTVRAFANSNDLAGHIRSVSDSLINSSYDGANPSVRRLMEEDPNLKKGWSTFGAEQKDAINKLIPEIDKLVDAGHDPKELFKSMAEIVNSSSKIPSLVPGPVTMIYRKTLEDHHRMYETKTVRKGDTYDSLEYVKAESIPTKDVRICFLPNPLPQEWSKSFKEEVSEETLLGLPFEKMWIEATGSWNTGPASSIEIENQDGRGNITIQFCGAFLSVKTDENGTPFLQVKAVMAAGAISRNSEVTRNTVFISSYKLTTHLVSWVQSHIGKENWDEKTDPGFKTYPIVAPSLMPIVGFLTSLKNKEIRMGSEKVDERFKTGIKKNRQHYKIKEIVHVSLHRKGVTLPSKSVQGREIDWTHRWEVSGHWRKIAEGKVGKNPQGEYGVRGFTWVVPHEKGPDDKPVIKKVRVVEQ